jgi:hypothetical protein
VSNRILQKLDKIDRRVIYILMALSVFVPLALKLSFPIPVGNGPSTDLYDYVDSLPEGSTVLLSFDYDPSTKAELQPMAVAVTRHLFSRRIHVIGMALWPQGVSLGQQAMTRVGDSLGVYEYEDWVNLGYTVAGSVSILRMGSSIRAVYSQDHVGVPYDSIPVLRGIRRLRDIDMVISLSAGDPGIHAWVMMAGDTYGIPIGGGCTAVSAPEFYTYLGTGQLLGLLGGLRGAADYETLLCERIPGAPGGLAVPGMAAQSVSHLVIMAFIVIGNIAFIAGRKGGKGGAK